MLPSRWVWEASGLVEHHGGVRVRSSHRLHWIILGLRDSLIRPGAEPEPAIPGQPHARHAGVREPLSCRRVNCSILQFFSEDLPSPPPALTTQPRCTPSSAPLMFWPQSCPRPVDLSGLCSGLLCHLSPQPHPHHRNLWIRRGRDARGWSAPSSSSFSKRSHLCCPSLAFPPRPWANPPPGCRCSAITGPGEAFPLPPVTSLPGWWRNKPSSRGAHNRCPVDTLGLKLEVPEIPRTYKVPRTRLSDERTDCSPSQQVLHSPLSDPPLGSGTRNIIIVLKSQVRKRELREVPELVQGHTARRQLS